MYRWSRSLGSYDSISGLTNSTSNANGCDRVVGTRGTIVWQNWKKRRGAQEGLPDGFRTLDRFSNDWATSSLDRAFYTFPRCTNVSNGVYRGGPIDLSSVTSSIFTRIEYFSPGNVYFNRKRSILRKKTERERLIAPCYLCFFKESVFLGSCTDRFYLNTACSLYFFLLISCYVRSRFFKQVQTF